MKPSALNPIEARSAKPSRTAAGAAALLFVAVAAVPMQSGAQSSLRNHLAPGIPAPFHAVGQVVQSPWRMEQSGTTADLRGIHAAGQGVVWASGTQGIVLRSTDNGAHWQSCAVPTGGAALDFRSVWAWDAQTAMALSSGPGDQSRLYRTTDGCTHWTLLRQNTDPKGFWDGLVFSDRNNGFLLGDPVGGSFLVEETTDGGAHWSRIGVGQPGPNGLAAEGRGAFAASNSAMTLGPGVMGAPRGTIHTVLIGTSGPGGALVLSGGISCGMETAHAQPYTCLKYWDFDAQKTPLAGGSSSAGVFSLAFLPGSTPYGAHAVAVGGDYTKPAERAGTAAWWTLQKGWQPATTMPGGYRSAVAYDATLKAWIAAGPNGSDVSWDGGRRWQPLEPASPEGTGTGKWNALSLPWVVGPHGRIARLDVESVAASHRQR